MLTLPSPFCVDSDAQEQQAKVWNDRRSGLLHAGEAVTGAAKAAHEQAAGAFDSANTAVDEGLEAASQKAQVRCDGALAC